MTKVKKNKMKTHKGMKKVFKVRKSGSIAMSRQGVLHNTGKRTTKTNRQKRNKQELHKSDYKRIKDLI
ncbi:MAG: bL35 family ribosomal protein [bacterium]|nr:bL35 family ribosomal protein [bacterium]